MSTRKGYNDNSTSDEETDLEAMKGRTSAGAADDSMVKEANSYASSIRSLVENTKDVQSKLNEKVSIVIKETIPEKLKINDLTALHVASKWYHILRYIKSSSQQVQRFNLASFIDSDLHDIIVDNHNLFLVHDDEPELEYYEFPSLALDSALIALFRAVSDLQSFKSCEKQLRTVDMFMDERKDSTFNWTPASGLALYKRYHQRFDIMLQIIHAKFGDAFVEHVGHNLIARIYCNGYSTTANPISKFLPYSDISSYPIYKKAQALNTIHDTILTWFRNSAKVLPDVEYFTDMSMVITFQTAPKPAANVPKVPVGKPSKDSTRSANVAAPAVATPAVTPPIVAATKPTAGNGTSTPAAPSGKKKRRQNMPCMKAFTNQECTYGEKCAYNHDTTDAAF